MNPLISCLMPTYNRFPEAGALVAEAVGSFLGQNYQNAELILVNDCPFQVLSVDHPRVRVINLPDRFATLGEKLNYAISQAQGDYLCRFDDDDISLPWRLRFSLNRLRKLESATWQSAETWLMSGATPYFSWSDIYPTPSKALWTRKAIEAVDGFSVMNTGQDVDLETRLSKKVSGIPRERVGRDRTYYIYRWTSQSYHLSVSGADGYAVIGARPIRPGAYTIKPQNTDHYVTTLRALPVTHA